MTNHFRSLLLNMGYNSDPTEHIPKKFSGSILLPKELQNFYNTLFPVNSSRFYKQFIVTNLLQLIEATPYNSVVTDFDKRITYDLVSTQEFFKVHRFSNPIITNTAFPIFVYGEYHNNIALNDLSDTIRITQQTNTNVVDIYSVTKNVYYIQNLTLNFVDNSSQTVQIPNTDLSFQIGGNNFTSTSGKKWTFIVESPFLFDFNELYRNLLNRPSIVKEMLNYARSSGDVTYENLWIQHPNPVYKIVGLLIAYVQRVNTII